MSARAADPQAPEVLRIVRGEPSADELAALITVLAGLARAATVKPPAPHSAWANPARRLRAPLHPPHLPAGMLR